MKDLAAAPWLDVSVPDCVKAVPSMLTGEELQYLIWVVATQYTGWGAVVDLGPWVGSSTAALADGLRRSGVPAKVVHSYDLFEWRRDYMEQYAPENLPEGSDFRPLLLRNVAEYRDLVSAEKMDLFAPNWSGEPIEILFVDAAKSWGLLNAILRGFGPYLVPGKSRVILQDFRFFHTYWLPLVFDSRPDVWREVEGVGDGTTVSFELLKAPQGPAGIHEDYGVDCFPLESACHLLEQRAAVPDVHQTAYLLMIYRVACIQGDENLMGSTRDRLLRATAPDGLAAMEELLSRALRYSSDDCVERGWYALKAADPGLARRAVAPSFLDGRADTLIVRGRAAQMEGDLSAAHALFSQALAIERDSSGSAGMFLAECELGLGHFGPCTAAVLRFLEHLKAPTPGALGWATHVLGECWSREQNLAVAQSACRQLTARFPTSPAILVLAATVAFTTQQWQEARRHAEAAIRADDGYQQAHDLLAQIHTKV